jgi:hypothetical protein
VTLLEAARTLGYVPDAQAETDDSYSGIVRHAATWAITSNCMHRHRSRETAERCAARMVHYMTRWEKKSKR